MNGEKLAISEFDETNLTYTIKNTPDSYFFISYKLGPDEFRRVISEEEGDEIAISVPSETVEKWIETATVDLAELEVVAAKQIISKEGITYFPVKEQKVRSYSGVSLLNALAIPSLKVNPVLNTVNTSSGESVAFFIDGLPADAADIQNIRPEHVNKVDVLNNPSDPRYMKARHVVNFVMRKYETGGYAKFDGSQRFTPLVGAYSAYNKTTHKRMTYEILAGTDFTKNSHLGSNGIYHYDFGNEIVDKEENNLSEKNHNENYYVTAKVLYKDDKKIISNIIGYKGTNNNAGTGVGSVKFNLEIYPASEQTQFSKSHSNSVSWNGNYVFYLPSGFSLFVRPHASYTKHQSKYTYSENLGDIINDNDEKAWITGLSATAQKQFSGDKSLWWQIAGNAGANYMDYFGSTQSNKTGRTQDGMFALGTSLGFGKFTVRLDGYGIITHESLADFSSTDLSGYFILMASYYINPRNSLSLFGQGRWNYPPMSSRNPTLVLKNQIDAVKGNPDIKQSFINDIQMEYNWQPLDNLGFSLFVWWERINNPITYSYTQSEYDGRKIMIRNLVNDGFMSKFSYGLNFSWQLLNNALSFNGNIGGFNVLRKGEVRVTSNTLLCSLQAQYTLKNFYCSAYWEKGTDAVTEYYKTHQPSSYSVSVGYKYRNINVTLSALNFLRSSWRQSRVEIITKNFNSNEEIFNWQFHRNFKLDISWSFGYGKQINNNKTIDRIKEVESGIL